MKVSDAKVFKHAPGDFKTAIGDGGAQRGVRFEF